MKKLMITSGFISFLLANGPAAADFEERFRQGMGGYHPHPHGGWFLMPFSMILFIILLIAVVAIAGRIFGGRRWGRHWFGHDQAMTTLRERFARGEIDKSEFEERKSALDSHA